MSESIQYWATTNAGNANSDPAISSSDTQAPNTVATNIRSIMAALAKYHLDANGGLTAGGTANALTVTTNQVLISAQLTGGLAIMVKAASTNTSASVTFAPDGLTAAAIKRADGSALAVGSITAGMLLFLVFNSATSEWWCANINPYDVPLPVPIASGGTGQTTAAAAALAVAPSLGGSFSANKNGSDQTGISQGVWTKITFGSAVFNVGSYFSTVNSRWTPPAGTVLISASLDWSSGPFDNGTGAIAIYKNGSSFKQVTIPQTGLQGTSTLITVIDTANGTDYYEIWGYMDGGTTKTVSGGTSGSWFTGSML